ncbi:hypothetical protein [Mucilaginibacter lappiensis]|uniref:Uncharacterized protein n=1 Tax=Mucilaginibacter lappiensis TaxID=354630 RepID=A0A841JK85_9SPHI|nr:hypothetical protein [Mucilaginibacter lappiensis]MBB6131357.1 hypothetical protein [Mucilaginibacter lappiensis]
MQKRHTKATFLRMIKALNAADQYTRRHDYAFRHSGERTESTKDLFDNEMLAVIKELEDSFKVEDQCDQMRKKIISIAHQMFWELPNGKADIARIDQWCVEQGPFKKLFNKHTIKELPTLVSVFEKVYKHYMSKI